MLELVLNVHEVDSPEHFMGINFSQFWSYLEEIDLLPDLLRCFLRNFHKVDSLPHFLSWQMMRIISATLKVIMLDE